MAGSVGGGSTRAKRYNDNSEINVTPFVDVMLVLLIIFMVAAPLASVNVKVDLPPSVSKPAKVKDPVYVSLQKGGKLFIGDIQVTYNEFSTRLVQASGNNYNRRIFIRADKTVQYKEVMRVMNMIQDTGFYQIALVAEDRQVAPQGQ
ncbi:MAG: biopolymer transporter ExbD [Alphaproteobacteria bacterium]|nr:biopolymer transporter ExbD [Alphaproteobacteria bacterium]